MDIKFIHITKTAGTSIENIGHEYGYSWSRYDYWYLDNFDRLKYQDCSSWHVPLQYYKISPYYYYDLFTIVRNPYERCISEFYCPWTGYYNINSVNKKTFNRWIRKKLLELNIVSFLPQHLYIYDKNNIQIVKNILKFEELPDCFNNFMKKNGLEITLEKKENCARFVNNKFTVQDLDKLTILMINNKYTEDFLSFDYVQIK